MENLLEIKTYGKELLPSNVIVTNSMSLTIIGNVAILYMDTVHITDKKTGYNPICNLPPGYRIAQTTDSVFRTGAGLPQAYTRTQYAGVSVFLNSVGEDTIVGHYLSQVFFVTR